MKHRKNRGLFGSLFILLWLFCGGPEFFRFPSSNEAYAAQLNSVQSGTTTIADGSLSTTVTITSVTTSKAFVVFSARLGSTTVAPQNGQVSGQITNATTLTFMRFGTVGQIDIKWYVAEFSSGVTVQREAQAITVATTNIPITSVDTTKSFVLNEEARHLRRQA